MAELNRETKAHYSEAGKNPDEYRQDQEESFLAEYKTKEGMRAWPRPFWGAPDFFIFQYRAVNSFPGKAQHLAAPVFLSDHQQQEIVSGWAPAGTAGFAFNIEHQIHSRIAPVRVYTKAVLVQSFLHIHPLSV